MVNDIDDDMAMAVNQDITLTPLPSPLLHSGPYVIRPSVFFFPCTAQGQNYM